MSKVPYEVINPFALGHMINHPPPEVSANVLFVDFDIPYNWFPSSFRRYLPYIQSQEFDKVDHYKTIAVLSS